ncbi:MAG: cell envelope integrity protein CreD [Balneolaceae bacterium]
MDNASDSKPQTFSDRNAALIKVGLIAFISLLLLIPTSMINSLVYERESTKEQAIWEVSQKWGEAQTLTGPFISVPYTITEKRYSSIDSANVWTERTEYLNLLPEQLSISGSIFPEKRYRGIYEIIVYNSDITLTGNFAHLDPRTFNIENKNLQLDKAFLSFGISDLKGIEDQISLDWGNKSKIFNPGTISNNLLSSGINVPLNLSLNSNNELETESFIFNVKLKGSQYINFVPVGKVTYVELTSDWPTPSFDGTFLPTTREVSEDGFTATWNVLHLNRNYPQAWIGAQHRVNESAFGVNLLLPVDSYQKTNRSIKYAILFIGLTFLVFFFIEIINQKRVHPIQYILVGLALSLFYTLLLSISEHTTFNVAYGISTALTIGLIAAYTKTILKSNALTGLMAGILIVLYLFIFILIQLQDYALLMGSVGLFVILGLVMYFSRKIDWYHINNDRS